MNNAVNNALNAAHPRSRGEHRLMRCLHLMPRGSSPLARGTHGVDAAPGDHTGLIPARAGNTPSHKLCDSCGGAHPRSRGEHSPSFTPWTILSGSSPLARGTQTKIEAASGMSGLIPARAGNTLPTLRSCRFIRAHPRSRGEHHGATPENIDAVGSSPLARGTRVSPVFADFSTGLIPARAGNTLHR